MNRLEKIELKSLRKRLPPRDLWELDESEKEAFRSSVSRDTSTNYIIHEIYTALETEENFVHFKKNFRRDAGIANL